LGGIFIVSRDEWNGCVDKEVWLKNIRTIISGKRSKDKG
jgi:hypothetical protein